MTQTETTNSNQAGAGQKIALSSGLGGIFGVKAGMTQVYDGATGRSLAVTVIDLKSNVVTQLKTLQKDGYQAVQVGLIEKKEKNATQSEKGHLKGIPAKGFKVFREVRLPNDAKMDDVALGMVLSPEFLKEGDLVDVSSYSKGKGFQGVMKKFHFGGGFETHGASVSHRQIGSIGNRADPGKVFKGKKMAGQMGNERVTVQNIKVVKVDLENGLVLIHGSIPGPKSGVVTLRRAVKPAQKAAAKKEAR